MSALIARTLAGQLYFHIHPLLLLFFMMELFSRWHFSVEQTSSILLLLSHSSSFLLLLFFLCVANTLFSLSHLTFTFIIFSSSSSFLCVLMTLLSHSFSLFFFLFIFWNFWTHQVWPHLQAKVSASPSSSDLGTVPMSQVLPHLQAKVSASPSSSGLMGRCPFHSTKFPLLLLLCFGRLLRSPPVNS